MQSLIPYLKQCSLTCGCPTSITQVLRSPFNPRKLCALPGNLWVLSQSSSSIPDKSIKPIYCLSIYLSILTVCVCIYVCVHMHIHTHIYLILYIYISPILTIYLSVYLSLYPSIYHLYPPREHLAKTRDIFGCHTGVCYGHLVSRSQGYR